MTARALVCLLALACAGCAKKEPEPDFVLFGRGWSASGFSVRINVGGSVTVLDTGVVHIFADTLRGADALEFMRAHRERAR